jgi:hypothetical protein
MPRITQLGNPIVQIGRFGVFSDVIVAGRTSQAHFMRALILVGHGPLLVAGCSREADLENLSIVLQDALLSWLVGVKTRHQHSRWAIAPSAEGEALLLQYSAATSQWGQKWTFRSVDYLEMAAMAVEQATGKMLKQDAALKAFSSGSIG